MFKLREAFATPAGGTGGGSRKTRGSKLAGNVNTSKTAKSKLAGNTNTSKVPTSRKKTSRLSGNV